MIKFRNLLLLLFISPVLCFAQLTKEQHTKIDSLKQVIKIAVNDTTIVNAWFDWGRLVSNSDKELGLELHNKILNRCEEILEKPEPILNEKEKLLYKRQMANSLNQIGIIYSDQGDFSLVVDYYTRALKIFEEIYDNKGIAFSLFYLGNIYQNQGDYDKSIDYYTQTGEVYKELGDRRNVANSKNNIGISYFYKGSYDKAIENWTKALKIYEDIGEERASTNTLANIGNIYDIQGNVVKALEYWTRARKYYEKIDDKLGMGYMYGNVANLYLDQKDYARAIENHIESMKLFEELGNKNEIATSLNHIGNVYVSQGDYSKALENHRKSLKIYELIGNQSGIASALKSIGNSYGLQEDYVKSLEYYTKSLEIFEKTGETSEISFLLSNIGDNYIDQENYDRAIYHSKKALSLANEMGEIEAIKIASQSLYKSYKKTGKSGLALQMYETYIYNRDSLESEANQKGIIRQEYKYNYEKKALVDSIQHFQEQKLVKTELAGQKQRSSFLFGGLALSLLFGAFIFNRFRVTRKQKTIIEDQKKLVESERDKSDQLLLNILPKDTAAELKEKGSVAAQSFPVTSVLFTDFKGFTEISEKMSPEELLKELNYCFSEFDNIMQRNGIEKIKTIGDAYMAASGVPISTDNHAKNIVIAALEIKTFMLKYANIRTEEKKPFFEVRIGVHSGPLVAGVVGIQKFQYDVWGDTVNVASRMESNSKAGEVNISESTYQLVKEEPSYTFTSRGKINVKGKGDLAMYFVEE